MSNIEGDERYKFTSKNVIHKVDTHKNPDLNGLEYRVIQELEDGYMVYTKPIDPSQPNPNYFIHKKYFV
jgi:hypothetical protein